MKNEPKYYFTRFGLFGFFFAISLISLGQVCINGVSTNPLNPVNLDPDFPDPNNLWLNSFDFGEHNGSSFNDILLNPQGGWAIPDFTAPAQFQMFSPFTSAGVPSAPHLSQPSPFQNRDFHWEDGWELLYLGTGYYPNGEALHIAPVNAPISDPRAVYDSRIPYMIYYNRYRGIIRLFAGLFTPYGAVQSLTVDLTMNTGDVTLNPPEKYTGLLRHLGQHDTPLDQATPFRGQRGVNSTGFSTGTSTNPRVWYTYDFQLGYDPCTCKSFSKLNFVFNAVQSSTASLYGRMITVEEPLVDASGNVTYNQEFLTASSIEAQDPNGYILRSSMDGLIEDYKTSLETYQNELEDRQFGRSQWFVGLLQGSAEAIVGGAVGTFPGAAAAAWVKKKKMIVGADTTTSTNGLNDDVAKYAQGTSKALLGGAYKYLSNMIFGDNKEPVRPSRPVASFSEMRFSGEIITQNRAPFVGFWTPGTNYVGEDFNPYSYPAYNEVLGLYATLRTPEVEYLNIPTEISTTTLNINSELDSTWNNGNFPVPCFVGVDGYHLDSTVTKLKTRSQDLYMKLKNPLQYALNPAVDINMSKTKIYLSYVITLENGDLMTNPGIPSNYPLIDSLLVTENEDTNLWLLHDVSQSNSSTYSGSDRKLTLSAGWYEVENTTNLLFGSSLSTSVYYREEYERFTPVCGGDIEFDAHIPDIVSSGLEFTPVKIEVKVMADMYFDQLSFTGEEINTTQVFTYLLLDSENGIDLIADSSNYIAIADSSNFVQMYPGELTIESEVITISSPEVSTGSTPNLIFVRADNIIIDKPLRSLITGNMPFGFPVKIMAYDKIHLKPGAHLMRNLNLSINKDIYGGGVSAPSSSNEVNSFCTSNSYQSDDLKSNVVNANNSDSDQSILPEMDQELVRMKFFPNPTSGQLFISSTQSIASAEVYDLSGRKLLHKNYGNEGDQEVTLNLNSLSNGVYVIKASSKGKIFTERLVVSR